jgi:hypothetical protein
VEAHLQPHIPLTLPPSGSRRASSRSGVGPAGVERYVRDGFDEFLFGGAVVHPAAVLALVIRLVTVTRLLAAVARGRPPASRRRARRQRGLLRVGSLTIARAPVDDRPRRMPARARRQTVSGIPRTRVSTRSRRDRFRGADTSLRRYQSEVIRNAWGISRASSRAADSVAARPGRRGATSMKQ